MLVEDPRRGVPEAILGAFGKSGPRRRSTVLVDHVKDDRPMIRYAAIGALGTTQSERPRRRSS